MGHSNEGYRSPRPKTNAPNVSPIGSAGKKDQMEVVVSPPPISSYTIPRGPESPSGIESTMYSPHLAVESATHKPCHVQIKTEQEAVNFSSRSSNNSSNRNFRCPRKEMHLSSRFLSNGTRAPATPDYTLSTKLGSAQPFNMSPSEKKSSGSVNGSGGGNSDGYLFGKVLENSMENLMKFAEVLYKCTLCTTLPSILTSRDSFISHVNDLHLTKKQSQKECQHCNLKFSTEEDLRAHCRFSHSIETQLGDEIESTEPSPIDEFTNKSETEINIENQCTVADPTKTIQSRTPRFIMESVHAKQRQTPIIPSGPLIRIPNKCSPGKEIVKPEKILMEENINRLQQLADQILISNSRLNNGGAGAAGNPSGFHGVTSNPSYTPDFGKYTKLVREGGNIVYFCQVCNCKCQVRAAFMSHCSSYQHRARIEAADRSVNPDHSPSLTQQPNQSNQPPPPPAHSHPHSQRHQPNSHQPYHHQPSHPLLLPQPNFKLDHVSSSSSSSLPSNVVSCSVSDSNNSTINNNNNNNNYSNTSTSLASKKSIHSRQTSSPTTPISTTSLTIPVSPSTIISTPSSSSSNNTTKAPRSSMSPCSPVSTSESSQASRSGPEEGRSTASPSETPTLPIGPTTSKLSTSIPAISLTADDPPQGGSPAQAVCVESTSSDCELDKESQRKRPRVDASSDGDSNTNTNCDREVTKRQRRKRHAPVAVRQPQATASWSDSDSEEEAVEPKNRKKSIEVESEEEDSQNKKNNKKNNDDDDNDDNSAGNSTSSSRSSNNNSSNSDSSRKSSSSSSTSNSSNTGTKSPSNADNNTSRTAKNMKVDYEHNQPDDKADTKDIDSQPKGSPGTDRKSLHSPETAPVPVHLPTPGSSPKQTNNTPVDFSMTDGNCGDSGGNSTIQNTDSLGVLSSVVEGFLVSKGQATAAFGSFDNDSMVITPTIKTEPEERVDSESGGLRGIYRCSFCDFLCYDIREYEEHFVKEHDPDLLDVTLMDSSGKTVHGEYWKMLKIKDILPELLVGCAKGYVSRDILLQKISLLLNIPEVVHWGPACNKAVREEFPNSLAQRKGKFKKTYYFGIALIEQLQEQEELSDSENVTYQPLRDLAQDLEKILQFLPELVFWTGDLDVGISRDEVLQLLGQKIEETGVQYWGVQCNRAMRFLFPSIHMKRKGKFKTTVYFGVDFMKNITRQIPQTFDGDPTMFIKSEPLDDSYDSVEPKSLPSEMTCAIFPTNVPLMVSSSPTSTSTAGTTKSYAPGIE